MSQAVCARLAATTAAVACSCSTASNANNTASWRAATTPAFRRASVLPVLFEPRRGRLAQRRFLAAAVEGEVAEDDSNAAASEEVQGEIVEGGIPEDVPGGVVMPYADVIEVTDFDQSQLNEDSIMVWTKIEGLLSESAAGEAKQALQEVPGARDITVDVVEGFATIKCMALTSIQTQEKAVEILEALYEIGFKPQSMEVGFADISIVDENSPPLNEVAFPPS